MDAGDARVGADHEPAGRALEDRGVVAPATRPGSAASALRGASAIRSKATSSRQTPPPRGAVVGFGGGTALAYHDPGATPPGDGQGGTR